MMRQKSAAVSNLLGQVANSAEALAAIQAPEFETLETAFTKDWRQLIPLPMRANWKLYSVEAKLAVYVVATKQAVDER